MTNSFPPNWYRNAYAGAKSPGVAIVDNTYNISLQCGPVWDKVRPQLQSLDYYWAMRKWVNQTRCGATMAPGMANVLLGDDYTSDSTEDEQAASTLDPGAIAGIVVGGLLLTAAVAFLVVRARSSSFGAAGAAAAGKENDWDEQFDQDSGAKFWVNKKTGEFSWTSPVAAAVAAAAPATSLAPVQEPLQTMNRATGEFSYGFPGATPAAAAAPATSLAPVQEPLQTMNRATGEFSYGFPDATPAAAAAPLVPVQEPMQTMNRATGEFSYGMTARPE
ncbi:hypothetical protein BASA81_008411 [Batrachochytrium salamandrivorans]|nr:hypothetical protein BASA81_008411 [Batrachochytrium salamandrivorans]